MKKLFWLLIFLMTISIGIYGDLWFQGKRLWEAHQRAEKLAHIVQSFNAQTNTDQQVQALLLTTQHEYLAMTVQLPDMQHSEDLLTALLKEGNNSGLEFSTVTPQTPVMGKFYLEIPVHLILSGTYEEFLNFLKQIMAKKYLIRLNDWQIQRQLPAATTVLKMPIEKNADNLIIELTIVLLVKPN